VTRLAAFGRFWWNFVVGDDWLVAAGLVVALSVTALVAHDDVSAWWLMPLAVVGLLVLSLRRGVRR
jgi:thiamine transporter ThiT